MRGLSFGERRFHLFLVGDVGVQGNTPYLGRDLFRILLALVEHADLGALGGHGPRCGGTQARAPAGDENSNIFQLHFLETFPWCLK